MILQHVIIVEVGNFATLHKHFSPTIKFCTHSNLIMCHLLEDSNSTEESLTAKGKWVINAAAFKKERREMKAHRVYVNTLFDHMGASTYGGKYIRRTYVEWDLCLGRKFRVFQ